MKISSQKFMLRQLRKEWEDSRKGAEWYLSDFEGYENHRTYVKMLGNCKEFLEPSFEQWLKEQDIEEDQ